LIGGASEFAEILDFWNTGPVLKWRERRFWKIEVPRLISQHIG
jgi:hypothetical protein